MTDDLQGKKVAILAADGVERVELEQPRGALHGARARTDLLSVHTGAIQARQSDLIDAGSLPVDRLVSDASVDEYDALLIPGGVVSPDKLRRDPEAMAFVEAFAGTDKPIAAICHAPWTLVQVGVVEGLRMTGYPSIWTDLRNAGAHVVDQEVVTDRQFTTSRSPADLPAFCTAILNQFALTLTR